MKLTVLVDNNTFIDQYFHGEPAASFYLETEEQKVLFDAGYSDILISNAEKMNIDRKSFKSKSKKKAKQKKKDDSKNF